jgi:hypothetical protein
VNEMNNKFQKMMERYQQSQPTPAQASPSQYTYAASDKPKPLSREAQAYFSRPALTCQLCGHPMEEHEDSTIEKWQRKWSIHWDCKNAAENQLDRAAGVLSDRKNR